VDGVTLMVPSPPESGLLSMATRIDDKGKRDRLHVLGHSLHSTAMAVRQTALIIAGLYFEDVTPPLADGKGGYQLLPKCEPEAGQRAFIAKFEP
jgi:hypothetical protein